ncbi:MAG: carbon-nitrogen hydrolase family protein [Planctomycetota bacterium]
MKVAAAQIAPVLLDRERTLEKILARCEEAAELGARLVAFPEAVLPGYPVWLSRLHGSAFDDELQKRIHARYLDQAVELPGPELERLVEVARRRELTLVVGVMERGIAAGRGTLYCTALTVHTDGSWLAHRKLVPTYEERLAWGPGDGQGLRVAEVEGFRVGALNCWENWMPAARMALYAQGEEVHVSLWPGSPENTKDISRFTAHEGRMYVIASSGVLLANDVPTDFPARDALLATAPDGILQTGGSRILAPDGEELAALDEAREGLITAELDRARLDGERQNFDPAGHYHRADVFRFEVDRTRAEVAHFRDPN